MLAPAPNLSKPPNKAIPPQLDGVPYPPEVTHPSAPSFSADKLPQKF